MKEVVYFIVGIICYNVSDVSLDEYLRDILLRCY